MNLRDAARGFVLTPTCVRANKVGQSVSSVRGDRFISRVRATRAAVTPAGLLGWQLRRRQSTDRGKY